MPWTGSSGAKQEGEAKIRRQHHPVKTNLKPRTGSSGGGLSSRSRRPPDWIIQGQVAAWRLGLDFLGLNACPRKSWAQLAAQRWA